MSQTNCRSCMMGKNWLCLNLINSEQLFHNWGTGGKGGKWTALVVHGWILKWLQPCDVVSFLSQICQMTNRDKESEVLIQVLLSGTFPTANKLFKTLLEITLDYYSLKLGVKLLWLFLLTEHGLHLNMGRLRCIMNWMTWSSQAVGCFFSGNKFKLLLSCNRKSLLLAFWNWTRWMSKWTSESPEKTICSFGSFWREQAK